MVPDPAAYRDRRIATAFKRAVDLGIGLVALMPLMATAMVAGLLILAIDRQRPWYVDRRVGRWGQLFPCLKLQTMQSDPRILEQHLTRVPQDREGYERERKLASDPRVTPLGRLLRKFSIDEFPQILNVLAGQMSLVGPRPLAPGESDARGALADSLTWIRPGLTGLWQVSGRSSLSADERARLDDTYVRQWSLTMDLRILARTPWVVIRGQGAR